METIGLVLVNLLFNLSEEGSRQIENSIHIVIGAFSILLLALSISAYRKTGLRKIVYAALAFALFAINSFLEILGDVKAADIVYSNIIFPVITLVILLLFFLAIVKRK